MPRLWRLNPNWTFIIVGAVILIAVILDQVVHIVQAARRVRHGGGAGQAPLASGGPPPAQGPHEPRTAAPETARAP
jgi:ribose transport system permease protein